ncbi:MAG: glycerol-3-phosphate dehydrogenase [Sulfurimonas sp. RIFOXYD12_FULL_33_39]|uniref:glycerol-3-phosphate dehydrogenase/oxidase n=1 Tax=unclassified Sulfurimonas TaxID=2623549 RepID=UPI0008BEE20B|nr:MULTISPECIES: glycerol-3-phosphate dehydrogenase/oxidase [unclassified Sulfurimonas]OHE02737.1 MAG: glycerol-3-phosphate dehydrogenase [Sulfurimonas sp. RIFCSPLOWO2_12_FULL_34_6]OHE09254.1 MAG: glycerol-3-phosphate dehydrogenase [Sulfurimonas sp. RIFOXYD12_FULL_33_39]OHE12963.1 MAG: glycerol-3-phosphate dehydrogenase [Sulfurimonas sp. RIFOXYD2_FULL_34_21]DAB27838.1 MAG TPA: glycerol-3-phosphate dehydrogenase [Sulfurimonas sp. UBA10385]
MRTQYDVVIIGAGINGVAIAKELAAVGKTVLVLEKNRIAYGASSHSSRLIHGGLRYLEHFEFALVREALRDQKYLLETYTDLVKLCSFYLPIYQNSKRPIWMIRFGLWLYSFFAKHGQKASAVSIKDFTKEFKYIKEDNLKAVFRYFDAKTDDYALTNKIAQQAKDNKVEIVEETEIKTLFLDNNIIRLTTDKGVVETNLLINAAGAWIDEINTKFNLPSSYTIEKLSGIHIVIDKVLVPNPLILETTSKRVFFIIPQADTTLIGTTERSEESKIDDIKINNEDIEYLLKESNRYLKTELKRKDIKDVYIGVRPLIKSQKDPTRMSREYKLDLHYIGQNKILHVYGGKLTTFPSLAKKAVEMLTKNG